MAGDLVIYPTDTLYGLGADPTQERAVERVFEVKGRPEVLAVPVIAADVSQVDQQVGLLTPLARRVAERFWPGPVTLVLEARPSVSRRLLGGRDSVAVRVPDHPVARALARLLGRPVTATSVNRSGQPAATTAAEAKAAIGDQVRVIVDGGAASGDGAVDDCRRALGRSGAGPGRSSPVGTRDNMGKLTSTRAAIVGLVFGTRRRQAAETSLDELTGLAITAGATVVHRAIQERPAPDPAFFFWTRQGADAGGGVRRKRRPARDL